MNDDIEKIVNDLKARGVFDEFRKECLSAVDTRPAFEHLRQKIDGKVSNFLEDISWAPTLNRNQLREKLRRTLNESDNVISTIEHLVDQVIAQKATTYMLSRIDAHVQDYLGIKVEEPQQKDDNNVIVWPDSETPTPAKDVKKEEKSLWIQDNWKEVKTEKKPIPSLSPSLVSSHSLSPPTSEQSNSDSDDSIPPAPSPTSLISGEDSNSQHFFAENASKSPENKSRANIYGHLSKQDKQSTDEQRAIPIDWGTSTSPPPERPFAHLGSSSTVSSNVNDKIADVKKEPKSPEQPSLSSSLKSLSSKDELIKDEKDEKDEKQEKQEKQEKEQKRERQEKEEKEEKEEKAKEKEEKQVTEEKEAKIEKEKKEDRGDKEEKESKNENKVAGVDTDAHKSISKVNLEPVVADMLSDVSSAHTSDLSDIDDPMSISSVEEADDMKSKTGDSEEKNKKVEISDVQIKKEDESLSWGCDENSQSKTKQTVQPVQTVKHEFEVIRSAPNAPVFDIRYKEKGKEKVKELTTSPQKVETISVKESAPIKTEKPSEDVQKSKYVIPKIKKESKSSRDSSPSSRYNPEDSKSRRSQSSNKRKNDTHSSQRYDEDDLYKPRYSIPGSRRHRTSNN